MHDRLNAREIEILRLVAQGLSNREIARALNLAPKTIEHLLGNSDPYRAIYPKIGVSSRAEAAAWYTKTYGCTVYESTIGRLNKQLIDVYGDYQSRIFQLRQSGQPQLAISMADFLVQKTTEAADQARSPAYRQAFLQLTAQALNEYCAAYLDTSPRDRIVRDIKAPVTALKRIGKEIGDRNSLALATTTLAGAYNIQKRYAIGRRLYHEAYQLTSDIDLKLRILRGITIAGIYLRDEASVNEVMPIAKQLIEQGNFTKLEQVCETCEGIGRGQGLLRSGVAFAWFEQTDHILRSLNHPPLRTIQFLISQQEVMMHMEPAAKSEIENLGKQAITLAERYGYARQQTIAHENLMASLNL